MENAFKKVGIYTKPLRGLSPEPIFQLLVFLEKRGVKVYADEQTVHQTNRNDLFLSGEEIPSKVDLVIVLGGDGTMLSVVRKVANRNVPMLGINFGSLGFLTEVPRDRMIPVLEDIFEGNFREEQRMKIDVQVIRNNKAINLFQALNDAVINKGALARIIDIEVFVGYQLLSNYKADGLIISTPTGSTAYSLSAGGPIMVPTKWGLLVTPICPHTLTHRPVVLDANDQVKIKMVDGEDVMLTVDGQTGQPLLHGDEVIVKRSDHVTRLIFPLHQSFFQVLDWVLHSNQKSL